LFLEARAIFIPLSILLSAPTIEGSSLADELVTSVAFFNPPTPEKLSSIGFFYSSLSPEIPLLEEEAFVINIYYFFTSGVITFESFFSPKIII
jgi:hypothetical protein